MLPLFFEKEKTLIQWKNQPEHNENSENEKYSSDKSKETSESEPEDSGKSKRSKRLVRYIPENTYSINDHEETLKNETVEPKDSEESDRLEITVRNEFFDLRWDKCIGYFKFNSKIHSAS